MRTAPLRRMLLVGALCASAGGLAACGSDTIATDVKPSQTPALSSPTGEGLAPGAGDQASQVSDLPTQTTTSTGPLPASDDASSDATDTGSADTSSDTSGSDTSSDGSATGATSTSDPGTSAGDGGTGGTSTPSGGGTSGSSSGTGTSTSGSGSSGSGTSTSGGSGGGATPSEFGEFCDTNPGVCR